jgi:hypothetical protein
VNESAGLYKVGRHNGKLQGLDRRSERHIISPRGRLNDIHGNHQGSGIMPGERVREMNDAGGRGVSDLDCARVLALRCW